MAKESSIVFISGGVRSGKSRFAETLACEVASKNNARLHYIAAGQDSDVEMKARIAKHKKDRLDSGQDWKTWEQPVGLGKLSHQFTNQDVVLLDCLTTLLNNEFFHVEDSWKSTTFRNELMISIIEGIKNIAEDCQTLIIVSNEVLHDMLIEDELVVTYKRMLGEIHQQVVSMARKAYLVEAGIPILMKGVD